MSIGAGIALFVIGAILEFAVSLPNNFVSLSVIGYILMGAGVVVFIIGLVLLFRRNSTRTTVTSATDPASGQQVTSRETSATPPPVDRI